MHAPALTDVTADHNLLIAQLPREARARLLAACEPVRLALGSVLCTPGKATRHVYFPNDACISLVSAIEGEPGVEVGMIGREGMLGTQLVLAVDDVPLQGLVQGAGIAQRIGAAPFRRELAISPALRRCLDRYVYVLMAQLALSAACTRFHKVGPRLARWLLMTQDRAHSPSFHLTHEFLARMLGVRRVGITCAAQELQQQQLIGYHRGNITVLDRAGLEAAACGCYAADQAVYDRTLGRGARRERPRRPAGVTARAL